MTTPRALVCGANGFIGSRIAAALLQAGYAVTCASAVRLRTDLPHLAVDFAADTTVDAWLPRVTGFDVVVNAVGVLRDSARRPMAAVHHAAPAALFAACAQAGVRRVVHISALGIGRDDRDNATEYARSKRAAESALQALPAPAAGGPSWIALRPSLVLGTGSDALALFRALAALPLLAMPGPTLDAKVQPVHVDDLARAVATLADPDSTHRGVVEFGGARPMTLPELIGTLRSARHAGASAARVLRLPAWVSALSARMGDHIPVAPWCTETRTMLERDSVASSVPLRAWLGAAPRDLRDFAGSL